MLISIVVPAYNEAAGVEIFHKKLLAPILKTLEYDFEIIYVNDGSKDETLKALYSLSEKSDQIRIVDLSRNFGKEIATTAGISIAKGDAVIILDADGQHPPKLIPQFLQKWEEGAQVVVGVRKSSNHEGAVKKWGSKIFYKLFNSSAESEIVPGSTDFRLIDKDVQEQFLSFTEANRITRGLIDWLGFQREFIYFNSPERLAGEANYRTSQLVKLALNSFISLSFRPLLLIGWLGGFITLLSLFVGIFIFIEQYILNDPLSLKFTGAALLGIFISFLVGIVLLSQGIMAVYLSHVMSHTQNRPLFVINRSRSMNIDEKD